MKYRFNFYSAIIILFSLFLFASIYGCGTVQNNGGASTSISITTIYSSSDATSYHGSVYAKGTSIYCAFGITDEGIVCYYKSTNEGVAFSLITKEALLANTGMGPDIDLAVTDSNMMYLTYKAYISSTNSIRVATIDASSGTSFTTKRLGSSDWTGSGHDLATDGINVFFAFDTFDTSNPRIRYSLNNEILNGQDHTLSNDYYSCFSQGGVACNIASSSTYEIVFAPVIISGTSTYELVYARSDDTCSSFTSEVIINATTESIKSVDMLRSNGLIHISYVKGGKLYSMHSSDSGQTWSSEHLVNNKSSEFALTCIDVVNGQLIILFSTDSFANGNLCIAKSSDDGTTWSVATILNSVTASWIDACHFGNKVYLLYRNDTGVYMLKSDDGGGSW